MEMLRNLVWESCVQSGNQHWGKHSVIGLEGTLEGRCVIRWKFLDLRFSEFHQIQRMEAQRTEDGGWRVDLLIYDMFVTHSNYITR